MTEYTNVGAIMVICYLIGMMLHNVPKLDNKWIPCIVGIVGAILGIIGWKVIQAYPADNILDAIAVGIVSGLASTGANQVIKQLKKD